jgi:hypothetical protein
MYNRLTSLIYTFSVGMFGHHKMCLTSFSSQSGSRVLWDMTQHLLACYIKTFRSVACKCLEYSLHLVKTLSALSMLNFGIYFSDFSKRASNVTNQHFQILITMYTYAFGSCVIAVYKSKC